LSSTVNEIKEDQKWGKKQLEILLKRGLGSTFEKDELIPKVDINESRELKELISISSKKKQFEGTERLFEQSRAILATTEPTQVKIVPEEVKLVTCRETGTYQVSFFQKRVIQVIPAVRRLTKNCLGHEKKERTYWSGNAIEKLKEKRDNLTLDPTIAHFDVFYEDGGPLHKWKVVSQWKHVANAHSCDHYQTEEEIVKETYEQEFWETDLPEAFSAIESNPNCKFLYKQLGEDARTRRLFFSCEPRGDSPCTALREQGGALVKKRCLQESFSGDCDLWEKTFDLGKKAAYQEPVFHDSTIAGSFDSSYEKNNELSGVLSTLSIFSDMKKGFEDTDFREGIEIFPGEKMQCQCSFIKGVLYDCCKKMNGLAVSTYLATCNSEEQALAERRYEGRCHHIGSKKENLGTQTAQIFCCFPTKLARTLHEEGRGQLGLGWGNADEPMCRGLSVTELHRIDFSKIDLSEAVEDLSINKEELLRKVRATITTLQSTGEAEGVQKTGQLVQKQEELLNATQK